jgi:hypothetical protein
MRVVAAILALALIQSCAGSLLHRAKPVQASKEPWKIVEDWTVQLPGGGMQIFPAYAGVNGIYAATTSTGTVVGVNTSSRGIQWQTTYNDVAFLTGLDKTKVILVSRNSGTSALDATTGTELWFNSTVKMSPNLAEAYNVLVFDEHTVVYRDQSSGFLQLCAIDTTTGMKKWCDGRRTLGSPDAAYNNTFTAQIFDASGNAYIANLNANTGVENWIASVDKIFTGSSKWVGVQNGTSLTIVNSMTGLAGSSRSVTGLNIATAVFVETDVFAFGDNQNWIAAMDCNSGELLWNVSAPSQDPSRLMQLQHVGESILVVATLSFSSTNFTRLSAFTGEVSWNVVAKPAGLSLAPVHAWLGTDILYVRNTGDTWSAWGADSGHKLSSGTGDLFLPRSVSASFDRPHFSYYVTANAGLMINLRIEANTN